MNVKNTTNNTLERPSAISTNTLGSIAAPSLTMATFLILLLSLNILINNVLLVLLELIRSSRAPVRKAREAYLIDKAMTLEPTGINRRDELSY